MRHWKPAVTLLTALALGMATGGCASDPASSQAPPVEDAAITSGVKAAIRQAPELQAADIEVATREGIVQLSGFVSSADNVATAASVARTVKGVKSVRNDLRLK